MARECAVCYGDEGSFVRLSCGHEFCAGCIKNWYLKGTGTGCPMCRRPVYFKGFHKVRDQWDEDAWENRCDEVFGEAFDNSLMESIEMADAFPSKFRREILADALHDLVDLERTYRFLKSEDLHEDDIAYVLFETGDYYSDRRIGLPWRAPTPPQQLPPTRYPWRNAGAAVQAGARARARMDPWSTVTVYFTA